jgi:hypothetical protein
LHFFPLNELGYSEPVPLEVGLAHTIEWERANPPAQIDPHQFDYAAEDAAFDHLRVGERIATYGS